MPGFDSTGPMGYGPMTGGRRGSCAGGAGGQGRATGAGRGQRRGGGHGWRRQYVATGLTGWQRAAQESAQTEEPAAEPNDPFARLEATLAEVIERLERLEAAGRN